MKCAIRTILLALLLVASMALLDSLGLFEGPNRHFYDLFFRMRGSRPPSPNILIAAIDNASLDRLGKWPIPRRYYAEVLARLQTASVVALDVLMDEPSEAKDDELLAEAISKHGRVVLPVHLLPHADGSLENPLFSGCASGHIHVEQGIDGVTRAVYHTLLVNGQTIPSFASAIFSLDRPMPTFGPNPPPHVARQQGLILQKDEMLINYYGPENTFTRVSVASLLDGHYPADLLAGKIVLVGLTALPGQGETLTPFFEDRSLMPGVEVQATILNNLMDGSFIRRVEGREVWAPVFLLSAACLLLFPLFRPSPLFLAWLTVMITLTLALFTLFKDLNTWFPPSPLYGAATLALVFCYLVKLHDTQLSLVASQRDWEESFHTIDDAIVIQDRDCEVIRANQAAAELGEGLVMRHLRERCEQLKQSLSNPAGKRPISSQPQAEDLLHEELLDEATGRWYEIRSVPKRDGRRGFRGMVHVVRDTTLRKLYEQEQRELHDMLTQAQKMEAIGTLAGGIAHDFNNILAGIMGYTEIVHRQLPDQSPLRAKLEHVLRASGRARDIINQLLTFSRREPHGKDVLEIGPLANEAIKLVRVMLPATIEIQPEIHTSAAMLGDPTQVHQILLNLSTNAFHAMKDTGGVLTIRLEDFDLAEPMQRDGQVLKAGAYIQLSVSDTGHGIAEDLRHRIFEPYFTTKLSGEGTGLGLSTVRSIVKDYGGLITLESELGKGTTFTVYFPRREMPTQGYLAEPSDLPTKGQGHILLVDDEPDLTELVREMLESLGYRVTSRNNPLEALELFRADPERFDVVITDMSMPKMTGETLAEKMLEIRAELPVILCTGYGDALIREKAIAAGIRRLIVKPFKLKELATTLKDLE